MNNGISDVGEAKDYQQANPKVPQKQAQMSLKARGLAPNNAVMKKCADLIKQVKETFRSPAIMTAASSD